MTNMMLTVMGYRAFRKLQMWLKIEKTDYTVNRFHDIYKFEMV